MTILEFVETFANQHLVELGAAYWLKRCVRVQPSSGTAILVLRLQPWETPDGVEKVERFVTEQDLADLDGEIEEFNFGTMRLVDILDQPWPIEEVIWYAAMFCFDEFIERAIARAIARATAQGLNAFTTVGVKYKDMGNLWMGAPDKHAEQAAMVADLRELLGA